MFSAFTQAPHDRDLSEADVRVLNKIIPDFFLQLEGKGEAFESANGITGFLVCPDWSMAACCHPRRSG